MYKNLFGQFITDVNSEFHDDIKQTLDSANPERKLIKRITIGGTPQNIYIENYHYQKDTTFIQRYSGLKNKVSLVHTQSIVTNKTKMKRKDIIKQEIKGYWSKREDKNQTIFIIKKYNKDKGLKQTKFRCYKIRCLMFPPERLKVQYYKR